ncbi:hypothetical protein FHX44_111245 [Pseudonocardia hierapolitana]|uniref:Ig-like domain-containing protein n=1 Tax=Pseudonocardia hierapolitana TaxID=1128676 RepID=A0A561SKG0_9PSEU|nr:hypothetical protein [Pseudonocardia hierapolitana]TWF75361.1 hypothetical protein FHX44_111245 [Pseudonocardia hierapolitana]
MADIQFPNVPLTGGPATMLVKDNNGAPATVLEAGLDFAIDVSWTIDPLAALLLGGQWELTAYVEGIGGTAFEGQVGATVTVPLNGGQTYAATITVVAGTLPDNPQPPDAGVYKLIVVLLHRNFAVVSNVAAVMEHPDLLKIG